MKESPGANVQSGLAGWDRAARDCEFRQSPPVWSRSIELVVAEMSGAPGRDARTSLTRSTNALLDEAIYFLERNSKRV